MVVPDFQLICEIMLVAEGFQEAKLLARKFIALYMLCRELLSKQDHYDWGLRAIKSVLIVGGKLKRDDKQRPEEQVLMRALRDFNMPKVVTDDVPVFIGLIGKKSLHGESLLIHHILCCLPVKKISLNIVEITKKTPFVKNISSFASLSIIYNLKIIFSKFCYNKLVTRLAS